ncbi:hypothetical protein ACHQM5_021575 [Ranunculus cassubicifolius]
MAANKLSMKLLIDKKGNRVLFAEAGKDVIDFLFSLLSLPQSVEKFEDAYILQPDKHRELLLNPAITTSTLLNVPLLPPNETSANPGTFYTCANVNKYHHNHVSNDPNVFCPSCQNYKMSTQLTYVPSQANISTSSGEKGYVKGVVTYMVMDDLSVKPMSTISSITLLNKFNVGNVGLLEERVVDLGIDEGLEVLKTSLESKNVFSKVFLEEMKN